MRDHLGIYLSLYFASARKSPRSFNHYFPSLDPVILPISRRAHNLPFSHILLVVTHHGQEAQTGTIRSACICPRNLFRWLALAQDPRL